MCSLGLSCIKYITYDFFGLQLSGLLSSISQGCFLIEESRSGLGDAEVKTKKGRTPFRASNVLKISRAFASAKKADEPLFEMLSVSKTRDSDHVFNAHHDFFYLYGCVQPFTSSIHVCYVINPCM